MRSSQLLAAVVALSSLSSAAWPDVFGDVQGLGSVQDIVYRRQDNSESAEPSSTQPKTTDAPKSTGDSSNSDKPTTTSGDDGKTEKSSETGKATGSDSKGPTKTSGKGTPTPTNFGDDVPAGGIAMITPGVFDGQQYYKIGDWVHFAWNYTSLSKAPSAVDVMATCTANQATYTIAVNQTVKPTGEVWWNTGAYSKDHPNSPPLLTEMFTLQIYDSNGTSTDTPKPGYLAPFSSFRFGMYSKQPYSNWTDFNCPTCNAAGALSESLTLKALLFTSTTTFASLLYFAFSFGVL